VQTYLKTDRLSLRRFTPADLGELTALHGDSAVMRYIDDGRPVPRHVVEGETLPGYLREYTNLPVGFGCWAAIATDSNAFLGWFSLRPAESTGLTQGTELGYRLTPEVWGSGYATEGAKALVHKAFTDLKVDLVVATTMTVNTGSRRVMEKAGLKWVRTFFEQWPDYIEGAEHGDVEYALSKADWKVSGPRSLLSERS
jgi:RimJ/RimL family protein N-acetyltransferase